MVVVAELLLDVEPGADIVPPGAVELLDDDVVVSGVVVPDALEDGAAVLLEDVAGGVVVVVEEDDVVAGGGVTVTLVVGGDSGLLQAASDSADSTASASIEGRFIRGSWSRGVWISLGRTCPRITCPTSLGRMSRAPYRARSERRVGDSRRCATFLHGATAKTADCTHCGRDRRALSA